MLYGGQILLGVLPKATSRPLVTHGKLLQRTKLSFNTRTCRQIQRETSVSRKRVKYCRPLFPLAATGPITIVRSKADMVSSSLEHPAPQRLSYPDLSSSSFGPNWGSASSLDPDSSSCEDNDSEGEDDGRAHRDLDIPIRTPVKPKAFSTPLGFHIPQDLLQASLDSPEGSEESYWQYSLYRGPCGKDHKVKVHYCTNKEQMEKVCREYYVNDEIVGLDLEWKASAMTKDGIKKNVSLIQIANEERVALFHIARFHGDEPPDLVAPTFRQIMESPNVIKAGVAIKGDCTRLKNHLGVQCRGQFELSYLYKLIKYHSGEQVQMNRLCIPLARQVEEYLQLPLLKGDVQTSDWWSKELKHDQVRYAASDSYAGFQLFHRMEAERLAFDPVPPRPPLAELNLPIMPPPVATVLELSDVSSESSVDSFESLGTLTPDEKIDKVNEVLANMSLSDPNMTQERRLNASKSTQSAEYQATNAFIIKPTIPPSAELDEANAWATAHKANSADRQGYQISPANLRAYHLWHHQNYEVLQITSLVRDPPLKPRTIIDYICEAVYRGNLPASPQRFAEIRTLGIEPVKAYHKSMLRTAVEEADRRERNDPELLGPADNIGWWKKR